MIASMSDALPASRQVFFWEPSRRCQERQPSFLKLGPEGLTEVTPGGQKKEERTTTPPSEEAMIKIRIGRERGEEFYL